MVITSSPVAARKFKVGDPVKVAATPQPLDGRIIEDRGELGAGGRRLLRVRLAAARYEEPLELEVAESDLSTRALTIGDLVRVTDEGLIEVTLAFAVGGAATVSPGSRIGPGGALAGRSHAWFIEHLPEPLPAPFRVV